MRSVMVLSAGDLMDPQHLFRGLIGATPKPQRAETSHGLVLHCVLSVYLDRYLVAHGL